jgi:integrase
MSKAKLGSIYPRGKKGIYWIYYWNADAAPGQPKEIRESTGTTDYQDAQRYLQRRQGEIAAGAFQGLGPERVRFEELSRLILEDYQQQQKKSLSWVKRRLKLHIIPALGKVRAAKFGTEDLNRYIDQRRMKGAGNGSINRELSIIKRVFNLAILHDPPLVARKPTVKMLKENNVRTGFLEDEQYKALRDQFSDDGVRLLFVALYHWGTRVGEMKPLQWTQVYLRDLEVRLNPGETKNGEGRVLPIYGEIRELLEMAKQDRDQNYPDCPWVFHREGQRIRNFRKAWATAVAAAGVPGLIPHDLRRTAVRLMTRAGEQETVIRQVTGHKTRAIFDRYNIVSAGDLRRFRNRMDAHIAEVREREEEVRNRTNHRTNGSEEGLEGKGVKRASPVN